jgi:hypothetical protein
MDQVTRLTRKVQAATTARRLETGFVTGERGIGKTSLAAIVRIVAETQHRVVGLHVFLGGVVTLEEMVQRVFDRLTKEAVGAGWISKVRDLLGTRIRQVGLFGVNVEFGADLTDLQALVREFGSALGNLVDKLRDERPGILLILDDINGLAGSPAFANWLKSFVDETAVSGKPLPVCLLLVGLEERRVSLIEHQPSLARILDLVTIEPWTHDETRQFFMTAFARAGVEVDIGALSTLATFAGGLPVLAHELGDAAFRRDTDGKIDRQDALVAVSDAAEIVGRKHIQPQVMEAIRSARYRNILRRLAQEPSDPLFQRSTVLDRLPAQERRVLDNFLRRMADLGVIKRDPERGPGAYQFSNLLHYLYFTMEAQRAGKQ